jgi:lipoprotein-anchoring transpeptidase ErfK/SrfK
LYSDDCRTLVSAQPGSDAPISFPETLSLPNRRRFGSDARFSCERPDRLRVRNSKRRNTRRRDPSQSSTGSESQTPSTGIPGSETQSESPGAPTSSNPAIPKPNSASKTTQPRKATVPDILIVVSKPTQTMTVTVDGHLRYRWRVSTGATHYSTPAGSYTPFRMELMHYSREWDNAGMPHAIFFTQRGHSIHGSDHPGLGTAVSHGCVRLTLSNAATLYQLVKSVGMAKTKVVVSGPDPPGYRLPTMPPRQPVGLFGGLFRF